MPFEPDIRPLITEALEEGKITTLPRHSPDLDFYQPCSIQNPAQELQTGRFGVPEPGPACSIFPAKQLDLALVPGLGFSVDGGRLGRGKGYYDRLLAEVPGLRCGVAFDCQVLRDLPLEPHDVRLNCLLTPTRWKVVSPAPVST
jgi:5-formyltetrahydrofolate cyclo-ligase